MEIEYKFNYRFNPKSNRLENYNYSENWWYFITICTKDRQEYFGEIIDGEMISNNIWKEIEKYYLEIPEKYNYALIDEFIIMPNHIHFIIFINQKNKKDVINEWNAIMQDAINGHLYSNIENDYGWFAGEKNCMIQKSLGKIINWFKWRCTFEINKKQNEIYFKWQNNYFDRIIRNENELNRIRKYIFENSLKWELEKNNEQWIFI